MVGVRVRVRVGVRVGLGSGLGLGLGLELGLATLKSIVPRASSEPRMSVRMIGSPGQG